MRQFFANNEQAFSDLEVRARTACIRFRNQEMPPGCNPAQNDVGFEVNEQGQARLLVTKGTVYNGDNQEIANWLRDGEKRFASFADLKSWITGPLREAFIARGLSPQTPDTPSAPTDTAENLTDMSAVREEIRDDKNALFLDEDELFERLRKQVLGQDGALRALCATITRHCARTRPKRPAVIFGVGPSGVGKTRTAEMLAEALRGIDDEGYGYQFLRLDMTEYQEAHRVSQLIGAPQGYVGHGEGSQLVDALQANSRTIVLFDEIEKAHSSILRVLMNAMDAGRLSVSNRSGNSREIDCRHAVFMFTSNLDSGEMLDELETRNGFGNHAVEDEVCRRRLHAAGIAPEIVGRIGRFLVYQPLSTEVRAAIMALAVSEVAAEYGLEVTYVEPGVIVELMRKLKSQNFGVRPGRYIIDEMLGKAFLDAAKQSLECALTVSGPPFKCVSSSTPLRMAKSS